MNLYAHLASKAGTAEAATLAQRLQAWHDEMVTHERSLRFAGDGNRCDDDCPHVEAKALWAEAQELFDADASELKFLSTRAQRRAGSTRVLLSRHASPQEMRL